MRMLTASIIIGPLLLIGGLAAASQSSLGRGPGLPVQMAADDDATVDQESFTRKAQDEMRDWQRKMQDFNAQVETKGKEAGNDAEHDLDKAWTDAQAASRQLQTAGAESWESAKTSFEKASSDLTDTWNRVKPEGK